jgi:thiol:disulfide interchange protein DsbC
MLHRLARAAWLTTLLAAGFAHADEASVKKALERFVGSPVVESVTKTPYGGLYEVVLKSGELVYTDEATSFLMDGHIIDTKTRRNITQARQNELASIDFASLPLAQAVKTVRGNGSRVVATFEDPNCGYCKKLAQELQTLTDVTVYTFLYPILSQDSLDKSRNIWCAADKSKSWSDWMLQHRTPASASCDTGAVDQNVALGRKLRIQGTPTIFLADGSRIGGYLPAAELEKAIAQAKAAPAR